MAAVEVGILLAALLFIRRMAVSADVKTIRSEMEYNEAEPDPDATSEKDIPPGVVVFEVQGPFFFGAVNRFQETVLSALRHSAAKLIVLRLRHVSSIDATGLNVILDFARQCKKKGLPLVLSGVRPQPFKEFKKYGVTAEVGMDNVCSDIDAALIRVNNILKELPGEDSKS